VKEQLSTDQQERRDQQLKEATDHEIEYMKEIERLRTQLETLSTCYAAANAAFSGMTAEVERLTRELEESRAANWRLLGTLGTPYKGQGMTGSKPLVARLRARAEELDGADPNLAPDASCPDAELLDEACDEIARLRFSYEQVRGMDDGEAIKAGLDSGDRLAHELANRLDLARGEQLRPMSCECEFDDYQAWQYKRICLFCGHEWYGLHCPHDGHQNPCPSCGKRPEVVPESRS
jgi:hypothetical protein